MRVTPDAGEYKQKWTWPECSVQWRPRPMV